MTELQKYECELCDEEANTFEVRSKKIIINAQNAIAANEIAGRKTGLRVLNVTRLDPPARVA